MRQYVCMMSLLAGMRKMAYAAGFGLFAVGAFSATMATHPHKAPSPTESKPKKTIEYNRDVRPILSKCFTCHGHDAKEVKANLRLDERKDAIMALPDGIRAIVPYNIEKSELVKRIYATDDDLMPPKSSNKVLTDDEKKVLKQWIAEGAEYKPHWAFVAPMRPTPPSVKLQGWANGPIDKFILAKLESEGLKPSPSADRPTLIRRVTLDITGLPPTPTEVDAFVRDRSPNAYEKVVDRLLASPRYAERMAMDWMDYARYADSQGYQSDWERFQWRWRDWVIDAFNHDMPYDEFTVDQIAGDLLPHPTLAQRIATGFNRNHRVNTEGGVIPEEWRVETVIDRVETTSTVWLGLTAGCARCHDHKYDPIKQKDFYSLCAYFNNVPETGSGEERPTNIPPYIKAPTDEQAQAMIALQLKVKTLTGQEDARLAPAVATAARWDYKGKDAGSVSDALVGRYVMAKSPSAIAGEVVGKPELAPTPQGEVTYAPTRTNGVSTTGAITLGDKGYVDLGQVGDFDTHDSFSYGGWFKPSANGGAPIARMDVANAYRGWDIFLTDDRPSVHLISKWPEDAIKVTSKTPIPMNQWSHVFATYDGSAKPEGIKIYVNGKPVETEVEQTGLHGSIRTTVSTKVGRRTGESNFQGQVDEVSIFRRKLTDDEVMALSGNDVAANLLAIPAEKRTAAQQAQLARLFLLATDPSFKALDAQLAQTKDQQDKLDRDITTVMVMEEMPKPRPAFILIRGQYDHPGAPVKMELPEFLKIKGKTFPRNRLGLAEWIVDPKNPLTARVTVNRLWERMFGTGIVATVEDFGTRAEYPSHPELLDWLATELIRLKWHLKPFIKELVMSATYRQSSDVSPKLVNLDPSNRLLARGPRFRLPAEVIRDQAMFSAGLLTEKLGGPSVRPYQPNGIWDETSVYGNLHNYMHDKGPNLHRRSLYTIWKRTAAPPNMTLFDVPTRESCRVQRSRTDTPLQALDLMNDVTYVEASRALAQRMLKDGGKDELRRLAYGFKVVLGRDPNAQELKILKAGLERRIAHYRANPVAATHLVYQGDASLPAKFDPVELAGYTVSASTILNLDETITKD